LCLGGFEAASTAPVEIIGCYPTREGVIDDGTGGVALVF
jgi:hypothetical protein